MGKFSAILAIPELRNKILITLLFLAVYRVGYSIPLPFVDQSLMNRNVGQGGPLGDILGYVSLFSGGDFSSGLFAKRFRNIRPQILNAFTMDL